MVGKKYLGNISIRNIIIIVCMVIMLLVVGIAGYIVFSNWIHSSKETTKKMANEMNSKVFEQINAFIEMPEHINEVNQKLIKNGIVDIYNQDEREKFFVGVLETHGSHVYSFSYGTKDGEYYGALRNEEGIIEIIRNDASTDGNLWYYSVTPDLTAWELVTKAGKFDPRTYDWYKEAAEAGKPVFSSIYKHYVRDDLTVSFAWPIYDDEGKNQGVLGAHIILSDIDSFLKDIVKDIRGYALIVEKNTGELVANSMDIGNFVYLQDGNIKRNNLSDVNNHAIVQAYEKYKATQENEFLFNSDEEDLYMNFKDIDKDGLNWVIITSVREDLLMEDIVESMMLAAVLILISVLLSAEICLIVIGKLTKPMYHLLEVAEKISSGDLSERVVIVRDDEIGKISTAFNKTADTMYKLINNLETAVKERTLQLEQSNKILTESRGELRLILNSSAEAIYGLDKNGNCTFCNASCLRILGYDDEDELLGNNMHEQIHHHKKNGAILPKDECKIIYSIDHGVGTHADDEVFWRSDGTSFEVEYFSYPQLKNGEVIGAVVTFMDISERKKTEEKIKYISCHDSLTGLYNRGCFEDEVKKIDTKNNLPISIIFGDVNGLKLTNDIFGHAAGDNLIKKSADVLKKACREEDIVARVGGDEFIIVLPKTEKIYAQKIIVRVKEELSHAKIDAIKCSMALGCDTKTHYKQSLERIMENAENEMYKEKTLNRETINSDIFYSMIETLHKKFPEEKRHSRAVSVLCEEIGMEMQLPETEVKKLRDAGFVHDIGKIILDKSILDRTDTLNEDDEIEIQQHAVIGYRILNIFDNTLDLAEGVYSHHENWDGSGYPKGIKQEEIPLMSRIIAIAEAYDIMTSFKKMTKEEALEEIKNQAGKQFDARIVDVFVDLMNKKEV